MSRALEALRSPGAPEALRSPGVPEAIACRGLSKRFGAVVAVDGADLEVAAGELVALVGPSGCGKTTLLRLVAGFERPDGGSVAVGGEPVAGEGRFVAPERRRVGMVFQDYALFPHLDVAANVAYGLGRRPDRARVEEMLGALGLEGVAGRRPHQLSGGQQQRVAVARALAPRPAVVLLDEPFSNLDAGLRAQVRRDLRAVLRAAGASALLVTHDQEEALSLADRVAVMNAGRVEQAGVPREVYLRPGTRWVAGFLGAVDELAAGVARAGWIDTPLGPVEAPGATGRAAVLIRPEALALVGEGEPAPATARPATVIECEYYGHDQLVTVALEDGTRLRHRGNGVLDWRAGERVRVWLAGPVSVLPAAADREP